MAKDAEGATTPCCRSGRVLAQELLRSARAVHDTLLAQRVVHRGRLDADVNLITKPFSFDQLARKIRTILAQSGH